MVTRQQAGGPPGDLRPEVGAVVDRRERLVHQLAPQVGRGVDLDEGEGDRPADLRRQPAHPVDLLGRPDDVLAGRTGGGQLEHAGARARRAPRRCRTARPRRRRCRAPARRRWRGGRSCGRSRSRARRPAIASRTMSFIAVDVVGGRRLVAGAALAHHVGPDRAVGDLRADVDRPAPASRARRGTRGRSPTPSRCPRPGRCRGCPRRPPSGRSASRAGRARPARTRRRSCPSRPW